MNEMETVFRQVSVNLASRGLLELPKHVVINIYDPKARLTAGLKHYVDEDAVWLPEYDKVAAWLEDNDGRGLLCYGNCGRGKSLLCTKIIPVWFNYFAHLVVRVFTAQQMNESPKDVLGAHIVCVDDIGTEGESVDFGRRRMVLPELVDAAERKGKLLILTTNLSLSELKAKYGERTYDRLRAITTPVLFEGKSLRK